MIKNKFIAIAFLGLLTTSGNALAASVSANINASQTSVTSGSIKTSSTVNGTISGKNNANTFNRALYVGHYKQVTMAPDKRIAELKINSGKTGTLGTTLEKGSHYIVLNPAGAATAGTVGSGELKTK
ncbi:MAG: hypothetical protein ACRDAU_05720 [Clostridium sp.]